jgi:hypothetical protein
MSTTPEQMSQHLEALGLRFHTFEDGDAGLSFRTSHYRGPDGTEALRMLLLLQQGGEHLVVAALDAYEAPRHRAPELAQVTSMISSRLRTVRFEHDLDRERLHLTVHLPLVDSELGRHQLRRCLSALTTAADAFHDVLRLAIEEGRVDPDLVANPELARVGDDISGMLDLLPPEVLEAALARVRSHRATGG